MLQLCLHGLVFGGIRLVDPADHLLGAVMQLRVDHFFLGQQPSVFAELFTERRDMPGDFIEHGLVAGVLDRGFEFLDFSQGLVGLLDLALPGVVCVRPAALIQAHPRFVHGLQHQTRHLADLPRLLDKLRALLALAFLEAIGTVVRQPGLQHIQVIGHAGHRPTGHFQGEVLGLGQLDELIECLAIGDQGLLNVTHHLLVAGRPSLETRGLGQQRIDTGMQGINGLGVGVQRIVLLDQAHLEQVAVERRHRREAFEALADGLQGPHTDGRYQGRQQQYQGKTQAEFFCHTEVGETSLHARNHCT